MAASNSVTNRGQFEKARVKSRQKCAANRASAPVKDAFILAASMAGDTLAQERAQKILKRTADMALAKKVRAKQGGVLGYLHWVALNKPAAFLATWSKVIPQQEQVDEKTEVGYMTVEEVNRELLDSDFPLDAFLSVLLELKANKPAKPGPTDGADE